MVTFASVGTPEHQSFTEGQILLGCNWDSQGSARSGCGAMLLAAVGKQPSFLLLLSLNSLPLGRS